MKGNCGLCGYQIQKGEPLVEHIRRNHPEIEIVRKKDKSGKRRYFCGVCGSTVSNMTNKNAMLCHCHTEAKRTGIITSQNATITDLDRFLEQVNKHIARTVVAEDNYNKLQLKYGELQKKALEYATKIVELQFLLASDNKNQH